MPRRPLIAVVGVLLLTVCALSAQGDAGLIEWSKTRKLTRADYQGRGALQRGVAARSFVGVKASWTCDGAEFTPNIRAVFDPNRSDWGSSRSGFDASYRTESRTADFQVLVHEQIHFDITELTARKIRAYFSVLTDVCTRVGGMVPLAAIVEDYQRDLDEEQARYDRQTLFGLDVRAQSEWSARVQRAIKDSEPK